MTKPYSYQVKGVQRMWVKFKARALLADDMGLGKSLQIILLRQWFLKKGRTLIVCPAYLKYNWEREWMTHAKVFAHVLGGIKPSADYWRTAPENGVWIINWEVLQHWVPVLKKMKFRLVAGDEIQYIGNKDSARSRAWKELVKKVKHIVGASGTPFENCPAELYPFLSSIDPKHEDDGRSIFGTWSTFAHRFCGPEWTPWGWKFRGASRAKELSKKLRKYCMVRRTKGQVLKDLPPIQKIVVPFELSKGDMAAYRKAEAGVARWLIASKKGGLKSSFREANRRAKMTELRQLCVQLKAKLIRQWLDDYLKECPHKIIMFGVHRKAVESLAEDYKKTFVMVNGRVKGRIRQQRFDAFINNPYIRGLSGNIKSCGTGWSAKGVPNSALFELPWTPAAIDQAISRTHGVGRGIKGVPSTAYLLIARGTIDEMMLKIIDRKQGYHDEIIDGKEEKQTEKIMDQLESLIISNYRGNK